MRILLHPGDTQFQWNNSFSAPSLAEKLDEGFQLKPEFMDLARETMKQIISKHKEKKNRKKKNKKQELIFVGIHSR